MDNDNLFIDTINRNMLSSNFEKLLYDMVVVLRDSGSTANANEVASNESE